MCSNLRATDLSSIDCCTVNALFVTTLSLLLKVTKGLKKKRGSFKKLSLDTFLKGRIAYLYATRQGG
jgi:hypothetical protein